MPHALRVAHEPQSIHDGVLRFVCETGNEEPGRQIRKHFVESGTSIFEGVVKLASETKLWRSHVISPGGFGDWQSTDGHREGVMVVQSRESETRRDATGERR